MVRVCSALGTWQLIILVAALRQATHDPGETKNILVLYGPGLSNEMKSLMIAMAKSLWDWEKIVWADDLLDKPIGGQKNFISLSKALAERIKIDQAHEIWLCKLAEPPEKLLAEVYSNADITLYEDGLHTYVPQPPFQWLLFTPKTYPRLAGIAIQRWLFDDRRPDKRTQKVWFSRHHLHRLHNAYLYIARDIRVPYPLNRTAHIHLIEDNFLQSAIDQSVEILDDAHLALDKMPDKRNILFLGQCFSRWNIIEREKELALYNRVIENLISKGFFVIWKEHPRNNEPFYPDLASNLPSDRISEIQMPTGLPIELAIRKLPDLCLVGSTTSPLIYFPHLFGIKAYTCAHIFQPYLNDVDFRYMAKLIAKRVPPVHLLV
jgi:hypothetical protein